MTKTEEHVILVDSNDIQKGTMEKMQAHLEGLLHRAVSVFICNSQGDWLLQQRAADKYHSNSLWTNTCCTHPFPNETVEESAHRRLFQEMGLQSELAEIHQFIYCEKLDNNLTEHEFDHVFFGISDDFPIPDKNEVMSYKYLSYNDLDVAINQNPQNYTVWFKHIYKEVNNHIISKK